MANPMPGADWLADLSKAMGDMRAPTVDMETVVSMQRKNMEALTQANQLAFEGAQAIMRHQMEMAQRSMEEFASMFTGLFQQNGSMEDRVAKHADVSKAALEKSVSHARELADLVSKANNDAFNVLSRRVAETLEELKDLAAKKR